MSSETGRARVFYKRKLFWAAVVYCALLMWSGVYRLQSPPVPIPQNRKTVSISIARADGISAKTVRIAYTETVPESHEGRPVVLVHGSPGDADVFRGLSRLMTGRRLIAIDLPGFGYSESDIDDYSIRAHAEYVAALMDELGIRDAHLVGFSLGGGVIAHVADKRPELVDSLTFISSIGVQEYELFGSYEVNHAIHGLQLLLFRILRDLTPHFGVFDGMAVPYARNFFDTDQRPLRDILRRTEMPFLIVHGKDDPLVPVQAAREHARIVPQAEYRELEDDHFFIFLRPEKAAPLLNDFFRRVDAGSASVLADAAAERKQAANAPFEMQILQATGAAAACLFLLLAILALINQDAAFTAAGVFAAQGFAGPVLLTASLSFGIVVSSVWLHRISIRPRTDAGSIGELFRKHLFRPCAFGFYQTIYVRSAGPKGSRFKAFLVSLPAAAARGLAIVIGVWAVSWAVIVSGTADKTETSVLLMAAFAAYLVPACAACLLTLSKKSDSRASGN